MPAFKYRAVDRTGRAARASLDAMKEAGLALVDGIRDLRDTVENPHLREVLSTLIENMEGGSILSQTMAQHPQVFDKVFVSLIRAGEQAGRLTEVFESLATTLRGQDELAAQTKQLMMYPVVVLVVVVAVMMFMLTYLVPQVVTLLKPMGLVLPPQTRALIFVSEFVINYWPLVFAAPILLAVAAGFLLRLSPKAQYWWDYAKLHSPVIGPVLQKIILSRFTNFFALMYRSGITVLEAIKTSEDIVANRVIAGGGRQGARHDRAGAHRGAGRHADADHVGGAGPGI